MMRMIRVLLVVLALLPAAASGQDVTVRGRGDFENDVFLRDFARRGAFTLITRDTAIGQGDRIDGDVLVTGATLRLDGTVTGDIVIVDGNLFLRPTAEIHGGIRNIGGGLYASELATLHGSTRNEPNAPYVARVRDDGSVLITGTVQSSPLVLDGFSGLLPPAYDRVNGLTLSAGGGVMLPRLGSLAPMVRGRVDYRSQRGDWGGLAELAVARRRTELAAGYESTTLTNERWIRDDISNSVSALVQGKDRRDYYEADRAYVELRRILEEGERTSSAFLRGQVEDASSLREGDPWSLIGDLDNRANLPVDDGRITSVIGGGEMEWDRLTFAVEAAGLVEVATDMLDGEDSFARYVANVEWAMPAIANHTLELDLHFQGPLPGTEALPRQRWSFVGGSGTLPTFGVGEFRGDRIAMVETAYLIPLPARFRMRLLGRPTLDLLHMVGMAWTHEQSPPFEQNLGLRLRYNVAYVRVLVDPEDTGKPKFSVGVSLPRKLYPWQREDSVR